MMISEYKKKGLLVVGAKQTAKSLKEGKISKIYIAEDAENHVVKDIKALASSNNVEIIMIESMKDLGQKCGITVSCAIAGVLFN
ncbi:MAG: ribosomal L7Ae/L30e/S12e/Gadd45 family protein [Peptostreptococcales bacterium]